MSRPVVLVTEGSAPGPLAWLRERAEVVECPTDRPGFDVELARADGLVVRTYTRVTRELLDRAPRLKVVGRGGVGIDNIDLAACRERGVRVVYTPAANTQAVSELVVAQIIRLIRPFAELSAGDYTPAGFRAARDVAGGRQLGELTVGIWGMGRVGRNVAGILHRGFGTRILYHDLLDVSADVTVPAEAVDADRLTAEADVLTLHVDGRPENRHLVDAAVLGRMKPSAVLVNTSRGEVLDARALGEALRAGRLAGAAIDVYDPEPPPADFPLLGLPNVILTPHMGARTRQALENMSWVVRDVWAVLDHRPPQFPA